MTSEIIDIIKRQSRNATLPLKPHLASGPIRICGVWTSHDRIVICDAADNHRAKHVDEIRDTHQRREIEGLLLRRLQTMKDPSIHA